MRPNEIGIFDELRMWGVGTNLGDHDLDSVPTGELQCWNQVGVI